MAEEKGRLRTLGGHFAKPFVAHGRYTKAAFGAGQIARNWRDIGLLWDAVRGRHAEPARRAAPLSALDLRTPRVQAALWQSAWACRVHTATAGLVFWAWTAEALVSGRWAGPFTALMALLVVAALGLKAFAEALRNWRLRTGLPGGPGALLAWEGGPLWPPLPERPARPAGWNVPAGPCRRGAPSPSARPGANTVPRRSNTAGRHTAEASPGAA